VTRRRGTGLVFLQRGLKPAQAFGHRRGFAHVLHQEALQAGVEHDGAVGFRVAAAT
jgi:hypothetical protein